VTVAPLAALAMSEWAFSTQFTAARLARFARLTTPVRAAPFDDFSGPQSAHDLKDVEVLLTSWGSPQLTAQHLDRLPRLQAVFHCAGGVRPLVTEDFWDRGIVITSAADANAMPVAEFTFSSIVLAGKRAQYFARTAGDSAGQASGLVDRASLGNHHGAIGIIGFSRIGRRVVHMLAQLTGTTVLVSDPYARRADVEALGAKLVPLEELLPKVRVLSIHAPELPETRHMIGARELAALPTGATVVNTARGSLIDHDALLAECRAGRLDAVLDVTDPEPLPPDSPLLSLPNVSITPHIAGSLGAESGLLVDSALDELENYTSGRPLRFRLLPEERGRMT
jgi:phosphoglycerate dehydrogenase-like enzyme